MNRDQAKTAIQKLIDRFAEHRKAYHAADYNEAKTRQDFINPFFKALGWDVDNENGMSEAYREVIYEDKVVVKGKAKAPDYGFRLMGQGKKRLFYVEAKKPSVALKANKDAAYQLRRYGSSAQAPISILTNFEDFFVYDCSKVPNLSDSASVSRLKHIHFEDYLKEFDFIYDTFSHEAVTKGRFDKFVQNDANKKGSQTLDKEFVQSLDTWRKYLATSIAVNNKKINDEDLNFSVQLIIDRLIFLRFCEDRSVEPYGQLQSAASKGNAYNNLFELFEQADSKYNSGLFDFEKDKLTATLKIDNKVVKNIVEDLYYPQCRYEFSVMPVEVLGNAYEQFLGKVIRITPARGVKIEEKPEVRKAGGVFYTPQYIVDYIVKNTVGKLIDGKAPKEIDKIKVVDPACGSGSFLVGAFEYLLHYHSDWYHHNLSDKEKKKGDILTPDGKLTTHEKKRILINNIYGVDLDANAVEVSKLSLLLKCMEGETEASIKQQVTMFHERILPDLDNNVRDGNSLIDTDFYDEKIELGFERKIKPFSWKKNFPSVFKQDGFDAIIGNPPYGAVLSKQEDLYLRTKYSVANYQLDTYNLFIERAVQISKKGSQFGFIIPSAWSASVYDDKFRKFISQKTLLNEIVIAPKQAFEDATVETCIVLFASDKSSNKFSVQRWDKPERTQYDVDLEAIISSPTFNFPIYSNPNSLKVVNAVKRCKTSLSNFAEVVWGVKVYEKGKGIPPQKSSDSEKKIFHTDKKTKQSHRPLLGGSEVCRYFLNWKGGYVDYGKWLAAPRTPDWFKGEKILVREVTSKGVIQAMLVDGDYVFSNSVDGVRMINNKIEVKYLLGILNCKLISFYHSNTSPNAFKGTFPKILLQDLRDLPIPEGTDGKRKAIVSSVDALLKLTSELLHEKIASKTEHIKQQIEHVDEKLNKLVYELYSLTSEEIQVVEGGANE